MKQSVRRRLIEMSTHVFVRSTDRTGVFPKVVKARVLDIERDVVKVRFEEGTREGEVAKIRFNEVEVPEGTELPPPRRPGRPKADDPSYANRAEPPAHAKIRRETVEEEASPPQRRATDVRVEGPPPGGYTVLPAFVGNAMTSVGGVPAPASGLHLVRPAAPPAAPPAPVMAHTPDAADALSELDTWLAMGAELQPKLEVEISRVTQEHKRMNARIDELNKQIAQIEDEKVLNQRKFDDLQKKLNMIKQFNARE